jgi:succinate-semialdehyde dehydrogenase/glutarate-semialdehyde dehydrogenase
MTDTRARPTEERRVITSRNPATEEVLATFDPWSADEVDTTIDQVREAQRQWRALSMGERADAMRRAAAILRERTDRYAALITTEMGKPISEARAEVAKSAFGCEHYAEHAADYLRNRPVTTESLESYVSYTPLGVVLAIMPWNFPFWQVFRAGVPILMAGNGVVLKHASNVPQCALATEEVFRDAGFPEGLLRAVLVGGAESDALVVDSRIAAVTLTGSSEVGAHVAGLAATNLKKQVLELGGSDPFVVLADADLDAAARVGARARNQNSGQSCIAAKRFIVESSVVDRFTDRLAEAVDALVVGDPMRDETEVGPLARADLRDALERQVSESVAAGAEIVTGGTAIDGRGYFYRPTVIGGTSASMPVIREETFGPVAAIIPADDVDEAVRIANDSPYGLGASVWTRNLERAKRIASAMEAGSVFVNGLVASDPRMPMGGVKRSGYGRELGDHGIWEFTNIQTVRIQDSPGSDR